MGTTSTTATGGADQQIASPEATPGFTGTENARHLTVAERVAIGKAARAEMPRRGHGEWPSAAGRADPVQLLEAQAASRVPELVPVRYGRMLVSPFTFY